MAATVTSEQELPPTTRMRRFSDDGSVEVTPSMALPKPKGAERLNRA
jgi:hypothetical protein